MEELEKVDQEPAKLRVHKLEEIHPIMYLQDFHDSYNGNFGASAVLLNREQLKMSIFITIGEEIKNIVNTEVQGPSQLRILIANIDSKFENTGDTNTVEIDCDKLINKALDAGSEEDKNKIISEFVANNGKTITSDIERVVQGMPERDWSVGIIASYGWFTEDEIKTGDIKNHLSKVDNLTQTFKKVLFDLD